MTVAFIGLGMMGAPMAASLARNGFKPRLFDANPGAIASFLEANDGVACSSAADAASGSDIVITMLPDGKAVQDAVLDAANGAAKGLKAGGIVVDMSSSSPVDTERLGKELAARGFGLIDAPVSGGVKRAIEGKLAIMAGGDPALIERCRPAFEVMGTTITLTGKLGSGHALKALNNFLAATNMVAVSEALLVGQRFGLDPSVMVDVFNVSTGRSFVTEVNAKMCILPKTFRSGFMLGLLAKDVKIASELSDHLAMKTPLLSSEKDIWAAAEKALGFRADHTLVYKYVEQQQS
ncbi:MAG: NAD(P)-dependent oxidoreductase [Bryobacteraceae bacterium]